MHFKRAYAEVWREFWRLAEDSGQEHLQVVKVKGHAQLSEVLAGLVDARARAGNRLADKAAKAGAKMHPSNEGLAKHRTELGDLIREAARWIGRVGQVVSPVPGFRDVEEADPERVIGPSTGTLRELRPLAGVVERGSASSSAAWWEEGGVKVGHATHRVWIIGDFAACLRCGAYMTGTVRRAYKLHAPCCGAPSNPSAALRLKRLRGGRHPLSDSYIEEPRLSRVEEELRVIEASALLRDATQAATASRPVGDDAEVDRGAEPSAEDVRPTGQRRFVADIAALYGRSSEARL